MTEPEARQSNLDGPLHWWRWPGPPNHRIVLLHGVGESHLSWTAVNPSLAEHGTLVEPDLPGHGLTPRAGRRLTVHASQRLLERFLSAEDLAPVILVGCSFGGAVAALHAARRPLDVGALVLTSSYHPPRLGGWKAPLVVPRLGVRALRHARQTDERRTSAKERARQAATGRGRQPWRDAVLADLERHDRGPADEGGSTARREANGSLAWWSMQGRRPHRTFAAIRCPTLVVHGRGDVHVPYQWAEAQAHQRADWTLRLIDDDRHGPHLNDPDRWLDAVLPWLARVTR